MSLRVEIPVAALSYFAKVANGRDNIIIVMLEEPAENGNWAVAMVAFDQSDKNHVTAAYDCDKPSTTPVTDDIKKELVAACIEQGVEWPEETPS